METGVGSGAFQEKDSVKLGRFDGTNYLRWQDRMAWLLTTLKLYYVLDDNLQPVPASKEDDTDAEKTRLAAEKAKRETDEMLCRGHILNSLTNRLYDVYRTYKSPKELWTQLEAKYKHIKQGTDKFLALKYFEFAFKDNMPIMDQVRDLEILVSQLSELQIKVPEAIQVGAILSKLPPTWNDYRRKMLHSSETHTIEQFITHLQIECENRARDESMMDSRVNYVTAPKSADGDGSGSSKNNNLKGKGKAFKKSGNFIFNRHLSSLKDKIDSEFRTSILSSSLRNFQKFHALIILEGYS